MWSIFGYEGCIYVLDAGLYLYSKTNTKLPVVYW
ncbi:hypothetical protein IC1_05565 [Bacillus cereus VD022]|uniref:Uncharacterized protein n=1 Tax=Bacillus cereus TIAC219 TaxID=718222 RepID=A0ABC9SSH9_BACCE|nr:hypothetical protein IC1_05565 [Bacillus cereus VD022]EOQ58880.1 hypothetical protein IAY_05630 [Bacillus cereus TIAC219]